MRARARQMALQSIPIVVDDEVDVRPVVETGAFEVAIVE
jgi:hypothetical protein